jgi:MFS family permease
MSAQPAVVPHRVGVILAVVQFFFALTWTVYVIFLPALLAQAGIAKSALLPILLADQLVFVAMDFTMGVAADRVAGIVGRLGRAVLIVTALSATALLLLPWVAPRREAWLFVALTAVWAITSSALRAPPMALLGRHAARPAVPWLASLTLLGLGVASAIAPYLTLQLRGLDPRWPFALSSVALVVATLGIVHVERILAGTPASAPHASASEPGPAAPGVGAFVCAVALLAIASQIHQFLNSPALYLRLATAADLPRLAPVFWIGFNLALLPAGVATRRYGGVLVMGVAGVVAALASSLAWFAGSLAELVAIQAVAGGAWGCVLASAVAAALDMGHTGREGRVTGALFSMLALAAAARIGIVAGELAKAPAYAAWLQWTPVAAWAAASGLLLWLASRRRGLFWRVSAG